MQALPDGWITAVPGLTRADQLRLAGGGVNPLQGELALRVLLALSTPTDQSTSTEAANSSSAARN
jgi:DNA (cytosine-5)-methyltransferase 1